MHAAVQSFVQSAVEALDLQGPVYEFAYRPGRSGGKTTVPENCFIDIGYLGSSFGEGAEIDRLEELSVLPYPSQSARTICSINVLEHIYEPQRAIDEMFRLLAPGGIVLVCTSNPAGPGGPSGHYWRISPQGIERLLHPLEAVLVGWQGPDQAPHTVFGVGCKAPVPSTFLPGIRRFVDGIQRRLDGAEQEVHRSGRWKRWLWDWTRSKADRQRESYRYKTRFALHFPMDDRIRLEQMLLDHHPSDGEAGTRIDFHG